MQAIDHPQGKRDMATCAYLLHTQAQMHKCLQEHPHLTPFPIITMALLGVTHFIYLHLP